MSEKRAFPWAVTALGLVLLAALLGAVAWPQRIGRLREAVLLRVTGVAPGAAACRRELTFSSATRTRYHHPRFAFWDNGGDTGKRPNSVAGYLEDEDLAHAAPVAVPAAALKAACPPRGNDAACHALLTLFPSYQARLRDWRDNYVADLIPRHQDNGRPTNLGKSGDTYVSVAGPSFPDDGHDYVNEWVDVGYYKTSPLFRKGNDRDAWIADCAALNTDMARDLVPQHLITAAQARSLSQAGVRAVTYPDTAAFPFRRANLVMMVGPDGQLMSASCTFSAVYGSEADCRALIAAL